MKRAIPLASALLLLVAAAAHAAFPDTDGHTFQREIEILQTQGIVRGYPDGTYRPEQPVSRAEFLKVLMYSAFGDEAVLYDPARCFGDFTGAAQWFWGPACYAKSLGIVEGYPDGTFRGTQTVNLVEALKMSMLAWKVPLPVYFAMPEHWYDPYLDAASGLGLFDRIARDPGKLVTRAELAAIIVAIAGEPPPITVEEPEPSASSSSSSRKHVCGDGIISGPEECDDGNLLNGDGCSKICVLVPEPIRHGALGIEQTTVGDRFVTAGADDVTLMRFNVISARQDTLLTTLLFTAETGNLASGRNYRLFEKRADGTLRELAAKGRVEGGDTLSFNGIGFLVPLGSEFTLELHAEIVEAPPSNSFGVGFKTDDPAYVVADGLEDGRQLSGITTDGVECTDVSVCWIQVFTLPAATVTFRDAGNLFVTKSTTPVPSKQLLLGGTAGPILKVTLRAEGEDIVVTRMAVGNGASSFDRIEIRRDGNVLGTGRESACTPAVHRQYCVLFRDGDLVVPANGEVTVDVYAAVKNRQDGGDSGETATPSLTAGTTGTVAVEARGLLSGTELSQNDGDSTLDGEVFIGRNNADTNLPIVGPTHDVVGAKIVSIANASPDPNETSVPAGTYNIGVFRFASSPVLPGSDSVHGVTITQLTFTVTAPNVQFDSSPFLLYNTLDPTQTTDCSTAGPMGSFTITCANLDDSDVSTAIPRGDFIDLGLRATITDNQVDPGSSTLQVSLNGLSNRNSTGPVEWDDGIFPFEWVDVGATSVGSTVYRLP